MTFKSDMPDPLLEVDIINPNRICVELQSIIFQIGVFLDTGQIRTLKISERPRKLNSMTGIKRYWL